MMAKDKRPRRSLKSTLIEPFKQVKLGMYAILISTAFVGLAAFMIYNAFIEQYQHVMGIFQIVDPDRQWELVTNDVFNRNAVKLGALFIGFLAVLFSVTFRMTHRIYGPLVSIERFVSQISDGHYGRRIVIRNGDELQRFVSRLNSMAEALEKRHGRLNDAPILLEGEEDPGDIEDSHPKAS